MTLRQIIEVLEAAERGEPIQACDTFNLGSGWFDVDPPLGPPLWNFSRYALRVKPREPRVRYFLERDGELPDYVYETRQRAEEVASVRTGCRVVEFREVL